jgi:glucose uptake protein
VTALLALVMVGCFGTWIPLSQSVRGPRQQSRIVYVALGNMAVASIALAAGGAHLELGWRALWLPVAGGVAWTAGVYAAFRAAELTGLARAAGTWTPLNIVTAFVLGIALFDELAGSSSARLGILAAALVLVVVGVLVIVGSQGAAGNAARTPGEKRAGLGWAIAAGVLWGGYFVPAQWARVSAQAGNFPLAIGILAAAVAMAVATRSPIALWQVRRGAAQTCVLLASGAIFGVGDVVLLVLVRRLGTGVGFTVAQLSLLVNAAIGIWVLKAPPPGSRAARIALCGIAIAGTGGLVIGALR